MKKPTVPTAPQLQALEDVARHGDPYARVQGMSQHGGWSRVMYVIQYREKWVRYVERKRKWVLTDDGARALARGRAKRAAASDRRAKGVATRERARAKTAIVKRLPDPYVTVTMPGVLLVREMELPASSLRAPLDGLLAKMGHRRVTIAISTLEIKTMEELHGDPRRPEESADGQRATGHPGAHLDGG